MKKIIAGWLAPDMALKADGWERLKACLRDEISWLRSFPEAEAATERVLERMRGWERRPSENLDYKWDADISYFRDQLARKGALK